MRGYAGEGVLQAIREAGGEIYAITSEPQTLARMAHDGWETDMEHVGDPHQEIADECVQRGWMSLFKWDMVEEGASPGESPLADSPPEWMSHPKGVFQPGVLVLDREGRVLYRWRCRPTRNNVGGAISRPTPQYVWRRIQAARLEPAGAPDAPMDTDPELDIPEVPWPFFVALLLANGWFVRVKPFVQREGRDLMGMSRAAMMRFPLFIAVWAAAIWLLPAWAVAVAFAGWLAMVAPGIRFVNGRFQHVGPDEEPA